MEKQLKGNVISHIKSSSGSPIITPPQEANSWQQTDVSPKLKDILNQESRSNKLYSQPVGESNRFDCPINSNVKTTQFGYNSIHPVEEALQCAKKAWIEQYDAAIFKRERAKIVKFLETQYRRINLAAMDVAEFVKSEKRMERFLSAPPIYSWKSFNHRIMRTSAEAVLLLEPYARALEREPSLNGRINQRFFAHQNSPFYSTLPRNVFIKQANDSFDAKQYRQCADAFKKAVDDMDTQYLQIRSARRVLFEADITPDTSCNIDLELSRVDEMVDWSVQEPEMCPGRQRMRRTIQSS